MNNGIKKLIYSLLVLTLLISQSSNLISTVYKASEYITDASEQLDDETIVSETDRAEEIVSEEGIVAKVVNSFKTDRSLVRATNGAASIEIVGYDESAGMTQETIYDIKVTADYGSDITSSGKTLELTLPDGMKFVQIPVVSGLYNTSGIDTTIVAQMGNDDPLTSATTAIAVPTKEAVTNSTFGTVKYEFNEGTKGVGITFKVQLDFQKIVESHTILDEIEVSVSSAGTNIGTVSQVINTNVETRLPSLNRETNILTKEMLVSTDQEEFFGSTSNYYFGSGNNIAAKNTKIYVYYPEGAEFVSVSGGLSTSTSYTYEVDAVNNCVVFTQVSDYVKLAGSTVSVTYKYPESTLPGLYETKEGFTVEFEAYNGEQYTRNLTVKDSVSVVVDRVNEMEIVNAYGINDDNGVQKISAARLYVSVKNPKSYTIENQVVEFAVDDTLETTAIRFPYDIAANNDQGISKLMYKTHQDDTWVTATQDQLDEIIYFDTTGVLELADIGFTSSKTLSEIKIYTGSYLSPYTSSVGVYADIIEPATSGTITYMQYDENNQANTTVKTTKALSASEYEAEQTAHSKSVANFQQDGKIIGNIIAGDTVDVHGSVSLLAFRTVNIQTLKDPVLYIRETDEYKVDINNLQLTFLGSEVDYTYEKQEDVNGNVVYKVMTSPEIEVGSMLNRDTHEVEEHQLYYKFTLITDPLATSDINNNDLVLYGSNRYDITGVTYNASMFSTIDTYDIDGDGSTTDSVLANTSKTLLMKPNTNIIVKSAFSKEGVDDTVDFINGDDSTAAVLELGETYEYISTVTNNAGESVDEFTAIIPVPKTGDNWGSFFQDEAFTWTMTLASLPTAPTGFEFYYSTDVTPSTILTGATWIKIEANTDDSDLDDIKMIKMVATHTIVAGEKVEVRVPFTISETYDSTISDSKAGNVNAFKVAYEQKTSSYNGVLSGTWAGATYILAPIIELEDIHYIVGDSADLLEKVVATDFYDDQIDGADVAYDQSIVPVVDGLYSEVGTYQVEYTAVDRNGLTVTGTRLIKIDGLPEVEAEDQVYYITESDIEGQVDDAGVGYANRAGSEVGSATVKEEISTTYEILSYSETLTEESSEESSEAEESQALLVTTSSEVAVDQTFDKVGYYDVKYTVVDSFGQVAETVVLVTVLDVSETPSEDLSEPTEEPSEEDSEVKSDKLSDMTIADTGVNLVGTIIATLAILISLIVIKNNLKMKY